MQAEVPRLYNISRLLKGCGNLLYSTILDGVSSADYYKILKQL
jgi:hypothetical protein